MIFHHEGKRFNLENVLFVPRLKAQLLSVSAATSKGGAIVFKENHCTFGETVRSLN